jgi:putative multiple sugar transport system permease protein
VAADGAEVKKSEVFGVVKRIGSEYGLLISLVIIMVFFQISTSGVLLQPLNLTNLVLQNSYIVIMSLGMLMVIVSGHIDLSVGSTAGLVGALAAVLMVQFNVNYVWTTVSRRAR